MVELVGEEMPDARVSDRDCFYKIERPGSLAFDMAKVGERLGRPLDTDTFLVNILLVGMAQAAVANGDHAMATTFLSIQSDEARHMANGYGTLMAVLGDESNVPGLNETINRHFWHSHKAIDAITGWQSEYGAKVRPWAFRDQWNEWVVDDFVGGYLDRLGEFGITPPQCLAAAAADIEWQHHTVGQVLSAIWPLNFWRSDAMGPADFEWFETNYPGWTEIYGGYWEGYQALSDPAGAHLILQELPGLPPFCQVCQLPCVMPRLDVNEARIIDHDLGRFALCSETCEWIFRRWPAAHASRTQFWARYHGWDLADVILDLGYVRPDGVTLMGQPTLNLERLWTIDDIRNIGYEVKDPMQAV